MAFTSRAVGGNPLPYKRPGRACQFDLLLPPVTAGGPAPPHYKSFNLLEFYH
jgi:hypothetical protein